VVLPLALVTIIKGRKEGQDSLKRMISAGLHETRVKHPLSEDDWFRASSVGTMCPREEIICAQNNIIREEGIDGLVGIVFAMGHGVHWMFQNLILPRACTLIGQWRCTYCGETYGSRATRMVPRPETCVRCGAVAGDVPRVNGRPDLDVNGGAFLYVEEWAGDPDHRVGGEPDGQFMYGEYNENYTDEDLVLIELKSANDRNYSELKKAPEFTHVIQAHTYMWLTGYKRAKIVYVNKNGYGPAAMHEHDISYDEETIGRVQDALSVIRAGIEGGDLPERTVCSVYTCPRAKRCKAADICFGVESA
jgi:hypothetical protein